jgi:Protein of unknown function (DUF1572)
MAEPTTHEALFIDELRAEARRYRDWAEQALAQVDDAGFFVTLDAESNSLALIVKHVAGNLRSRWLDFFTTDGEKADRQREREFLLEPADTRAALMASWDTGWSCLLDTLDRMTPADVSRTVVIRAEPHTVTRAALRSLAHTAGHVGQIVLLAKHVAGDRWRSVSIPRGQSDQMNAMMRERFAPTQDTKSAGR